jgi:tRNA(His) guanylyltransferase
LDGKGFSKFTNTHNFKKPNDKRGLDLMNKCAQKVIETFSDIILAYGQSDEYSFAFKKQTNIFQRRGDKIISTIASCFSASYAIFFKDFF